MNINEKDTNRFTCLSWDASLSGVIIIGLCRCTEYVPQADAMLSEALIGQSAPASHRMSAARWWKTSSFDNGASGSR